MKITLQIKRHNLELIKAGTKLTEWREHSLYNKKLLFSKREDGKFDGNKEITEIEFINGYLKEREKLTVECLGIRLVRFSQNIELPSDNFSAKEGQFAIEIKLGKIIQ